MQSLSYLLEKAFYSLKEISYSKLITLDCPFKFSLKYLFNFEYKDEAPYFKLGKVVHKIYELYLKEERSEEENKNLDNLLKDEILSNIDKSLMLKNLFILKEKVNKFKDAGYTLFLEHPLKRNLNELTLFGILDLVLINENKKNILFIDHKTSKKFSVDKYILQAMIYSYLLKNKFEDYQIHAFFNFIRDKSMSLKKVFVDVDEKFLYSIIDDKIKLYFENPTMKNKTRLCAYCEYYEFCSKYDSQKISLEYLDELIMLFFEENLEKVVVSL